MNAFNTIIYILAAICIVTGLNDFVGGIGGLRSLGANLSDTGFADPVTDNVIRFFAGIWIGVGILFIQFLRDLERYKPAMITLMGIVFLGGIGRIISIIQYGMPESPAGAAVITVGLVVEVGLMPILTWWLASRKQKFDSKYKSLDQ